jgi:hypothetical protein
MLYIGSGTHGWRAGGQYDPAQVAGAYVEFGTYPIERMLQALVIDRWLKFGRDREGVDPSHWRARMLECFCPDSAERRGRGLEHSRWIHRRALEGPAEW